MILKKQASEFKKLSYQGRKKILEMVYKAGGGHIGGAYSCIDILITLYGAILKYDVSNPKMFDRDRFIFSKGHSCLSLYFTLANVGFFDQKLLDRYCVDNGFLAGHPGAYIPGVELTSGSLGHGLSVAVGMAFSAKYDKNNFKVFTLLGDGELNEGSVWEAFMSGAQWKLDNLVAIIDSNKLMSLDTVDNILSIEPLGDRLRSFGWAVFEVDGHDFEAMLTLFKQLPLIQNKPLAIIAHTFKGKGASFMENSYHWHNRAPNEQEYHQANQEFQRIIDL